SGGRPRAALCGGRGVRARGADADPRSRGDRGEVVAVAGRRGAAVLVVLSGNTAAGGAAGVRVSSPGARFSPSFRRKSESRGNSSGTSVRPWTLTSVR